jgi:CRP/FNR family cyclic AMP-dependent transcriptional regulator
MAAQCHNRRMVATPSSLRPREVVLRDIGAQGITKKYPARTVLIHEGDVSTAMFIILAGRVKVHASDDSGKEVTLDTLGPGEYVGELALDGGRRDASVTTIEPTTCAVVDASRLLELIATHPDFAIHLIHGLIGRVRSLSRSVKSLALEDVYHRVVNLLHRLAEPVGTTRVVREKLTQQQIAERVGSSREMVSRIFKELTTGGYIEVQSGRIVLLKRPPAAW